MTHQEIAARRIEYKKALEDGRITKREYDGFQQALSELMVIERKGR
jgi:hypothetical protein